MRDDRDIQRSKPASAPEKGRGPQCGKDRRSTTVCPCRHVPTCHGFPAKAFQVSLPAVHLPRNPCESVPGVSSRRPPATVSPQKCVRCHLLPSTWHGIPAKAFQVSFSASHLARNPCKIVSGVPSRFPPATESPQKRVRCPFPAAHLARKSRESVPGVLSRCPPGTESLQKRVRCLFPLPTCYGIPAKVFQVAPLGLPNVKYTARISTHYTIFSVHQGYII